MISNLTTARPYAKTVFSLALRNQQFSKWQSTLDSLAIATVECQKRNLLNNPNVEHRQILDVFFCILGDFPEAINLVRILATHKKLNILPSIALAYKQLCLEHEQILEAIVISSQELNTNQKERLITALQKRYKYNILLQCKIDPKLLGGAIIYVAGQVIDGSIKSMLQRLQEQLM